MELTKGVHEIKIGILNLRFYLFTKRKIYKRFMFRNKLQNEDFFTTYKVDNGSVTEYIDENGLTVLLVCIFRHSHRVIYHEALHLTHSIMELKGISINNENSEIQAYLQGHIVKKILTIIKIAV